MTTVANGNGWTVSWSGCTGGACTGGQPVTGYRVTSTLCSGGGFVGTPPSQTVGSNQTTLNVGFDAAGNLVGKGLSFSVQAVGSGGQVSNPTSDQSCTIGWRAPDAAGITLSASTSQGPGATITANLSVNPAPGPQSAAVYGADGAQLTFSVGGLTPVSTTAAQATISGLSPGQVYPTQVSVAPAGHPQATVTVQGPQLSTPSGPPTPSGSPPPSTSPWPADLALQASGVVGPTANQGTVNATVNDAFGNTPSGARPTLSAAGTLTCGNVVSSFSNVSVAEQPSTTSGTFSVPMNLAQEGGACSLSGVQLSEQGSNDHGGPSQALSASFTIGDPQPQASQFSATWSAAPTAPYSAPSTVTVSGQAAGIGADWSVTVTGGPSGCQASGSPAQEQSGQFTATLDISACVAQAVASHATSFTASATISWTYLGQSESLSVQTPAVPLQSASSSSSTTSPTAKTASVLFPLLPTVANGDRTVLGAPTAHAHATSGHGGTAVLLSEAVVSSRSST